MFFKRIFIAIISFEIKHVNNLVFATLGSQLDISLVKPSHEQHNNKFM